MDRQYIGILVDGLIYSGIKYGISYFERISFYEEACEKFDLIPCFFRLSDIISENEQISTLIKNRNGKYEVKQIPTPSIIHNRGLFFRNKSKEKIRNLQTEGIIVFNDLNRYGKLRVYELLMQNEELIPHLPETVQANRENFISMMERHEELIIKPKSGSLGGGVIKVARTDHNNAVVTYNDKKSKAVRKQAFSFSDEWPKILTKKIMSKHYIIQQRILLATFNGNSFDMRVSVQRNGKGEWQVTGIVGKVAKSGGFVTNVAKGGECKSLVDLLNNNLNLRVDEVYKSVESFSLKAVKELNKEFPNMADVGLDVGITEEGFPMFIECNGRDLRITFRRAGMYDVWKATYATPISYARYLLDSKIEQGS
ncbi:YheC/YheD family protein [Bacillaceae bacterium Marseille-Q3522]|nr:YheC/YheD family protein [Bacillaceae bacterium Marseille-Q3522]